MSQYRKELGPGNPGTPMVNGLTGYLLILRAVESKRGLVHGQLHDHGESCAVGSFFDLHAGKMALTVAMADEVAAVNDAVPHLSPAARKRHMLQWLRWKLGTLGWVSRGRRAPAPAPDAATMATLARQVEDVAAH
jgi:hypothetical protein